MNKYKIRILVNTGTQCWVEETITAHLHEISGCYKFYTLETVTTGSNLVREDKIWKYYPLNNTIVEQLD